MQVLSDGVRFGLRLDGDLSTSKLAVLGAIRHGALTRGAIAERLGLSLPFVSSLIKELQAGGLVAEGNTVPSSGGRRPRALLLSQNLGLVLGLDLGAVVPRAVVADFAGEILSRVDLPARCLSQVESLVGAVVGLVPEALGSSGVDASRIRAVGLSIQAMVDREAGLCFKAGHLHSEGVLVGPPLQERLGRMVAIDDVSRCLALGESFYGAGKGVDNLLVVLVDTGVGAGLVVDGEVFRGSDGIALELGHVSVADDGPRCRCGNRGCVQTYASATALVESARLALADGVNSLLSRVVEQRTLAIEDILAAARAGDKLSYRLLARAGEALGSALASALNLLGSKLVIIHSPVPGLASALLESVRHQIRMRALPELSHRVRVEEGWLGPFGPAMGAAVLATNVALAGPLDTAAVSGVAAGAAGDHATIPPVRR